MNNQTKRVNDKSRICLRNEVTSYSATIRVFSLMWTLACRWFCGAFATKSTPARSAWKRKTWRALTPSPYPSPSKGEGTCVIPNCGFWQVRRVSGANPARPSEDCVEPSELPIIQDCFEISNFANRSFDYCEKYATLNLQSRIKRDSVPLLLFRMTVKYLLHNFNTVVILYFHWLIHLFNIVTS